MSLSKSELSVELWGRKYSSPVFLAAGTAGYGFELHEIVPYENVAGIFSKAITLKPLKGNPPRRLIETQSGVLNNIGFQNLGVEKFTEVLNNEREHLHPRLFVNLVGQSEEDLAQLVRRLESVSQVTGYEVNLSSHLNENEVWGMDSKRSARLIEKLRLLTKRPLIVKLFPQVTHLDSDAKDYERAGADGLTVSNTLRGMHVDVRAAQFSLSSKWGGVSGPAIKPLVLKMVWDVAQSVQIPVIGVGGILTTEDVLEYLMVGARAVQVGTAIYRDPRAPQRICRGLSQFLTDRGYKDLSQVTGLLTKS